MFQFQYAYNKHTEAHSYIYNTIQYKQTYTILTIINISQKKKKSPHKIYL